MFGCFLSRTLPSTKTVRKLQHIACGSVDRPMPDPAKILNLNFVASDPVGELQARCGVVGNRIVAAGVNEEGNPSKFPTRIP